MMRRCTSPAFARRFFGWAAPDAARNLLRRPSKVLFRLTADIDALGSLYLRILVPMGAAIGAAVVAVVTLGIMHPAFGLSAGAVLLGSGICVPIAAGGLARKPARRRTLRHRGASLARHRPDSRPDRPHDGIAHGSAMRCPVLAADRYTARADRHLNRIETGITLTFGLVTAILLASSLLAGGGAYQSRGDHCTGCRIGAADRLCSRRALHGPAARRPGIRPCPSRSQADRSAPD